MHVSRISFRVDGRPLNERITFFWPRHMSGGPHGAGDEVTRSGLLGTPDLVLSIRSNTTMPDQPGTFRSRSSSHAAALASDGARQSPRGDSEPPAETFGPFGIAERLNWLKAKNRRRNTSSQ